MHTCVLALGILLASQLADSSNTRYPMQPVDGQTAAPVTTGQHVIGQPTGRPAIPPAGQQPWAGSTTNNSSANASPATASPTTSRPGSDSPQINQPPARTAFPRQPISPAQLARVGKSAELLEGLLKPVGTEKLNGLDLSLAEAVQTANSRGEQTRRVKLYWSLSQAVAEYRLTSLEMVQMQGIHGGLVQPSLAWQQAQEAAANRRQVAKAAVQAAQLRLQKELGNVNNSRLPLPVDLPHCGAYETRYHDIFRTRTSREAEQISQLLPLRRQELGQRAIETVGALEAYNLLSQQRSQQDDGSQLLKAYQHLALQRKAFVVSAYRYNKEIARYTELAVPQKVRTGRLVAMLIQSDGTFAGDWQRGSIRRTSAEEAVPSKTDKRYPPRTFAENGRNEVRRVPLKDKKNDGKNAEQSIVVSPDSP